MQEPGYSRILSRITLACIALSLLIHTAAFAWFASADTFAGAAPDPIKPEDQSKPDHDQSRLGLEASKRATINWLGFADPTPHSAQESETDQAALSLAPDGAPEPPAATNTPKPKAEQQTPAEDQKKQPTPKPTTEPTTKPDPQQANPAPAQPAKEIEAPKIIEQSTQPPEDLKPTPKPEPTKETQKQPKPTPKPDSKNNKPKQEQSQPAPKSKKAEQARTDTLPGIIDDRESTPTAKVVNLAINDWGKPAAGKGIKVKPVRPVFPATTAIFNRQLNAVVLIEFGPDGLARNVTFEQVVIKGKKITRHTGSAQADRVLINSVYNWTASGEEIDALAPTERLTIRMRMQIRP